MTPHEIRVALFAGPFIEFLDELNGTTAWRALYGKHYPRLRDQELVLRVLALYVSASSYRRPLKAFLNAFVGAHRQGGNLNLEPLTQRFTVASELLLTAGNDSIRVSSNQINAALTEALYVGLMRRLDHGTEVDAAKVTTAVEEIKADASMNAAISRATADEDQVRTRLEIATASFSKV